jgi:ribosomal protein S18 acetylase RimI-like enzyme
MTAIQQEVDEDDQKKKGAKWTMTTSTQIVGFVEIAMLRNPVLEQQLLSSDTSKYLQQQQQSSSPRGIVLIRTDDDDDDDDATKKDTTNSLGIVVVNNNKCFTPAITNLGVAPSMRRRGIAQRLIRVAERYVKHHWERPTPLQQLDLTDDTTTTTSAATTPMGLYVDITNQPAIALYEKCGYQKRQMVQPPTSRKNSSTTGDGPTMWYMQKVNAMT